MPARIARMVSTSNSSTSVNAFCRRAVWFLRFGVKFLIMVAYLLFDIVLHREYRIEHPDENCSYKCGNEKNHQRFQKCH